MKKLDAHSPFSSYLSFASSIGLEIIPTSIGYELWKGDRYKGGFTSTEALAEALNLQRDLFLSALEKDNEARKPFLHASARLSGAREAAVMINGRPAGICLTLVSKGGKIKVSSFYNGVPVNVQVHSVSFSRKNVADAKYSSTDYSAFEYEGDLYYVRSDSY